MGALTKADMAEKLYEELGLNKREAKEIVELSTSVVLSHPLRGLSTVELFSRILPVQLRLLLYAKLLNEDALRKSEGRPAQRKHHTEQARSHYQRIHRDPEIRNCHHPDAPFARRQRIIHLVSMQQR